MGVATMKVPTIFTAVDRFSGVVSKMTATTSAFGRTAEAAAMRTSRRFNSAGTTMLYTGATIATGLGYAVNEAVKFEKAMATVSTTLDNTTPEMMKGMGEEVLAMSKIIPKSISELTTGLYDVVSAGIEGAHAMTVLKASGRLAVAGLGTTQEGVDILTSSINSFNISATESESIANNVFKAVKYGKTTVSQLAESFGSSSALVKNANVSLAEYLATTAVLTTTGMTASRAQTQVASAVTALIKPSKSMQAIFDSLGVKDIPTFIKNSKGLIPALEKVRNKADEMGILTSKAFGRKEGFSAMLSLLGPLRSKYNEVLADMTSKTDTLTESVEKQQATTAANFQRLKNNVTILAIRLGDALLPRINAIVDKLTPMISGISKWAQNNKWLANTLMNATMLLLGFGVAAKVAAALMYGYATALKVVRFAMISYTAVMRAYNLVSLAAAVSGRSYIAVMLSGTAPILGWVAPLLAVSAALYGVYRMTTKNGEIVRKFGEDNTTHLKIVSGEYESMESRIARSNERITASMKKLKLDLESIEKTGKTVAEVNRDKISAVSRASNAMVLTSGAARNSGSTFVPKPLAVINQRGVLGNQIMGDSDKAFRDVVSDIKHKNLAGSKQLNVNEMMKDFGSKKGELTINLKDPGKVIESVNDSNVGGIPIRMGSTGGSKNWGGPNNN